MSEQNVRRGDSRYYVVAPKHMSLVNYSLLRHNIHLHIGGQCPYNLRSLSR